MLLQQLRRMTRLPLPCADESDASLLAHFARARDGAAFEAIVRKHGPMVLGVCQRLLDAHLAEDAFQATFLVLIRRAATIRRPRLLANWLYGVAQRTALAARRLARRCSHPKQEMDMLAAPEAERLWHDLRPVIDEELSRLPEKYRLPILLCYIQGRTNEEAARQLGWTKGTVSGRLARARELLRGRLARRGVTLSAAALAGFAGQASAALPPALVQSLRQAAADPALAGGFVSSTAIALSEGVVNAMFLKTLKNVAIGLFLVLLIGAGAVVLVLNLYAGLREQVPVTVAGLAPIHEADGLEAQVLKAQKTNRARFTRGVLHWTFHAKVDGFAQPDQKYETHGVYQLWWDGDRLATRNMYDQASVDPFGQFSLRRRGERTAWDGKLFRRAPNEELQEGAHALLKRLQKTEIGLKPSYRHHENWFDIIAWSEGSQVTMLRAHRDPTHRHKLKSVDWELVDDDAGKQARLSVKGESGGRAVECYDLARGGEMTRLEWFDDKGGLYLRRRVSLKKIDDGWFPVEVDGRSIEPDTGKVTLHQHFKLDLKQSGFNREAVLPAGVFSLPPVDAMDGASKP